MPFEQDKRSATSERQTAYDGVYFIERLMVKSDLGLYLGTIVIRTLRPLVPTPRAQRTYLTNLKDVVEGRIDAAA